MRIVSLVSTVALLLPVMLLSSACSDEDDDFDNEVELRPVQAACPPCYVDVDEVHLGLSSEYDPASVLNLSLVLSNSQGIEEINYGTSINIPRAPDTVTVTDSELCTVGGTGLAPTNVMVTFKLDVSPYELQEEIPIKSTCP